MKILNKIVIALAVLLAPAAASAQYFDHLTAGVAVGTDGVSLQVAAPVGEIVELRLNGSWWPSFIHTSVTRNLNMTNYDGTPRGAKDACHGVYPVSQTESSVPCHTNSPDTR